MNVLMVIYTPVSKCVTTLMGHTTAYALTAMNLALMDFRVLVRKLTIDAYQLLLLWEGEVRLFSMYMLEILGRGNQPQGWESLCSPVSPSSK